MGLNNKHTLQSGTIVLVTGAAGFIGLHVSQALLERGCVVIGYDNCNDYYDVSLKEGRLGVLSAYPEFIFIKGDHRYQLQRPHFPQESLKRVSRA